MINKRKNETNKTPTPISFCNEYDDIANQKIYVAVPVNHKHYPFTLRLHGSISPIKFDHEKYKIEKPDFRNIKSKLISSEKFYKLKISDFLNHSVKIGQLWQPLIDLIDDYINFCEQQVLDKNINNFEIQINTKNNWNSKKYELKEICDNWIALMSKTDKINKPIFKEARTLIFKTAKIIIPLTEYGLNNSCLMNSKQPLIIAWISACASLSSIGAYIHSLLKHSKNIYNNEKYNELKNKINYFWSKFAKLIKSKNNDISKQIKLALIESKIELDFLKNEENFINSIQKYFSKTNHQKALKIINETDKYIKIGLKLIDFKRDAVDYINV